MDTFEQAQLKANLAGQSEQKQSETNGRSESRWKILESSLTMMVSSHMAGVYAPPAYDADSEKALGNGILLCTCHTPRQSGEYPEQ